jgi:hypothetical protein
MSLHSTEDVLLQVQKVSNKFFVPKHPSTLYIFQSAEEHRLPTSVLSRVCYQIDIYVFDKYSITSMQAYALKRHWLTATKYRYVKKL